MSTDLNLAGIEEILMELRARNISFIFAWADHNEFNKSPDEGIVWGCEHGGNLALQITLLRFLTKWMEKIESERTAPGAS